MAHLINVEDRALGVVLGACVGDILGANSEFMDYDKVAKTFPPDGVVKDFIDTPDRPFGMYTDDTEMLLALAKSIAHCKKCDAKSIANHFVKYFFEEPKRGYGPSVRVILCKLKLGAVDIKSSGTFMYPEGSFANGSVMRIAPLAIAFRNCDDLTVFHRAVYAACMCTHVHPEAVDGAFIQALAVKQLMKENAATFNCVKFVTELKDKHCKTETLKQHLQTVLTCYEQEKSDIEVQQVLIQPNQFGKNFQIKAIDALATCMFSFLKYWQNPEECIIRTASLGGDADTTSCIVGALCGALHGKQWIPKRWYDNIENKGDYGRDALEKVAKELALLDLQKDEDIVNDK